MQLTSTLILCLFFLSIKGVPLNQENLLEEEDNELNYRLPNNSLPLRYDLWIKSDVDKNIFDFTGRVKIRIRIIEPTEKITLHARQLTINNIDLLNSEGLLVQSNLNYEYHEDLEFLIISLPAEVAENEEIVLDISYYGILHEDGSGFYRSNYQNVNGETVWIATTQFEMTDTRHGMPCYDEPGIRAVIGLEIQHGSTFTAISNMPILTRDPINGTDYILSKFQDTPPMQSYLLAFIISDYKYISNNDTDVEQRIYAAPQRIDRGDGDFAVQVVGPILRQLEEHFKVKYPLPKMDHAAITFHIWGAMENFGLIIYHDADLLFVEDSDPISKQMGMIEEITHEYVHQYFGNIVNPKWWTYTWLNEAFATLFADFIPSLMYPDAGFMQRFEDDSLVRAFTADSNPNAKPLNLYVQTPAEIRSKFDDLAYRKGGSFLRMIQEALTVPTFAKGLNYYLNEMYYSPATPQDLHRALQVAYDEDFPGNDVNLDQVMTTWEEQAGFPIVSVRKDGETFVITQQRYNGGSEIYSIPLSYTSKSETNFENRTPKIWLTTPNYTLPFVSSEDWIILNIGNTGYYKVFYDESIWSAIARDFRYNHQIIPAYHRAQLFKDMKRSLIEDKIEAVYGLQHMSYLGDETFFSVWHEAIEVEAILSRHLFGTRITNEYIIFIEKITKPHVDRLGFNEGLHNSEMRKLIKTLSCKAFQHRCLTYEHQMLVNFLETRQGSYNLCEGLRYTGESVQNEFINIMLNESENRTVYIDSLGCALNPSIIRNYLQILLNGTYNLSAVERSRGICKTLGTSTTALTTTMDFVRQNVNQIEQIIPGELIGILDTMTTYINTNDLRTKLYEIVDLAHAAGYLTSNEIVVIDAAVNENLDWMLSNYDGIENFLHELFPTQPPTTEVTFTPPPTTYTPSPGSMVMAYLLGFPFIILFILIYRRFYLQNIRVEATRETRRTTYPPAQPISAP